MPTEKKIENVERIKGWFDEATIIIATDPTGMGVSAMTDLRRALRESDVEFRVIKNRLAYLAADAAGKPWLKEIIEGPTGLVFGYDQVTEPAKALSGYIRSNRSPLTIKKAAFEERVLTSDQVESLASLPSKDVLIARLMGQLQAPISGLAQVLNGPVGGLARALQGVVESRSEAQESEVS